MIGNNRISNTVKEYALNITKTKYGDFGPTLATKKLCKKHNIRNIGRNSAYAYS